MYHSAPFQRVSSLLFKLNNLTTVSYKSAAGMPTAAVFDEFLKLHPKAKVILTVRDSPEEWVKSFKATIMKMYHLPHWFVWVNQLCGGPVGHISNKIRNSGKTRQSTGRSPVENLIIQFFNQCSKQ